MRWTSHLMFFLFSIVLTFKSQAHGQTTSDAKSASSQQLNSLPNQQPNDQKKERAVSEILPCGNKPNCVSTEGPESHKIPRWRLLGDFSAVKEIVKKQAAEVVADDTDLLHVVYRSLIFRFPDDVIVKNVNGTILLRSSSRVGYSDMGVNRKRMERLAKELKDKNLIEIVNH